MDPPCNKKEKKDSPSFSQPTKMLMCVNLGMVSCLALHIAVHSLVLTHRRTPVVYATTGLTVDPVMLTVAQRC